MANAPFLEFIGAQRQEGFMWNGKTRGGEPAQFGAPRSQGAGRHDLGDGLLAAADDNFLALFDVV